MFKEAKERIIKQERQRVKEWFKKKSTKQRASCQSCRHQIEARKEREAFRLVWESFDKELGLGDEE